MNIEVALLGAAVACGLLACASAGVAGDGAGGAAAIPGDAWQRIAPAEAAMDKKLLDKARDYALAGGGSGCVIRGGRLVYSWGDQEKLYDLKSTTKSIAVTALGLALADGRMKLDDLAGKYHKELAAPAGTLAAHGWAQKITLLQLATQTAGFEKPGGYGKLLYEPGTRWSYSDAGPNWLAECVTLAYGRDVDELMFERVFGPLGIGRAELVWRKHAYRPAEIEGLSRREFGSGISANVNAMARIGLLYLRGGRWGEQQIIPADFVAMCGRTHAAVKGLEVLEGGSYGKASDHYGLLWWNNADGTLPDVPPDAYWSWGLYESLIVVVPSLDLVAARAGGGWDKQWGGHYDRLAGFLNPLMAASGAAKVEAGQPPYGASPVIKAITWAEKESIRRAAYDSDNWPITWAGDGHLYTSYGDGRGFEPFVEKKLSMGLCRVEGGAEDFRGLNIRSQTLEGVGNDKAGRKASGLLSVDGTLYILVRNAGNAQLGWSKDLGLNWQWAEWKFTTSFGCPTFLNFGRDYAGARDEYVYVYSFDSDSAYVPADRMVLARVHKEKLADRAAWEFFVSRGADGRAEWSPDIAERGAVFANAGKCYRSGVSYNAGVKRYLWYQILPGKNLRFGGKGDGDPRFKGSMAVFDAPEPWGPWTTAYHTELWDVGPGESGSFPTKWMSADGLTVHLVFSGDDYFSVRRGKIELMAEVEKPASGE